MNGRPSIPKIGSGANLGALFKAAAAAATEDDAANCGPAVGVESAGGCEARAEGAADPVAVGRMAGPDDAGACGDGKGDGDGPACATCGGRTDPGTAGMRGGLFGCACEVGT